MQLCMYMLIYLYLGSTGIVSLSGMRWPPPKPQIPVVNHTAVYDDPHHMQQFPKLGFL